MAYWAVDPSAPYATAIGLGAFHYPPPFVYLAAPLSLLPFDIAYVVWTILMVGLLIWMTRSWALAWCGFPPVASELFHGNIHIAMAALIVVGLRYPPALAVVGLAKLTTGVALLWPVFRRDWRSFLAGFRDGGWHRRGVVDPARKRRVGSLVRSPVRTSRDPPHRWGADRHPSGRPSASGCWPACMGSQDRPPVDARRRRRIVDAAPLDPLVGGPCRPARCPSLAHRHCGHDVAGRESTNRPCSAIGPRRVIRCRTMARQRPIRHDGAHEAGGSRFRNCVDVGSS